MTRRALRAGAPLAPELARRDFIATAAAAPAPGALRDGAARGWPPATPRAAVFATLLPGYPPAGCTDFWMSKQATLQNLGESSWNWSVRMSGEATP